MEGCFVTLSLDDANIESIRQIRWHHCGELKTFTLEPFDNGPLAAFAVCESPDRKRCKMAHVYDAPDFDIGLEIAALVQ